MTAGDAGRQNLIFGLPATTVGLLLLFLAAVDSIATVLVLRDGRGSELNPLMAWLIEHGDATFVLVKLLLTALCVKVIIRRGAHPYARLACLAGLAMYLPIVGLHIYNNHVIGLL